MTTDSLPDLVPVGQDDDDEGPEPLEENSDEEREQQPAKPQEAPPEEEPPTATLQEEWRSSVQVGDLVRFRHPGTTEWLEVTVIAIGGNKVKIQYFQRGRGCMKVVNIWSPDVQPLASASAAASGAAGAEATLEG